MRWMLWNNLVSGVLGNDSLVVRCNDSMMRSQNCVWVDKMCWVLWDDLVSGVLSDDGLVDRCGNSVMNNWSVNDDWLVVSERNIVMWSNLVMDIMVDSWMKWVGNSMLNNWDVSHWMMDQRVLSDHWVVNQRVFSDYWMVNQRMFNDWDVVNRSHDLVEICVHWVLLSWFVLRSRSGRMVRSWSNWMTGVDVVRSSSVMNWDLVRRLRSFDVVGLSSSVASDVMSGLVRLDHVVGLSFSVVMRIDDLVDWSVTVTRIGFVSSVWVS